MRSLYPFLFFIVLATQPAFAHAILIDGAPASSATVPPGPLSVRLRFNSRIDADRSRLTLVALSAKPNAMPNILRQTPPETPNLLEAQTSVVAGSWVLRWQVLAVDGHITRGEVPFTVAEPAATAPHVASKP